MHCAASRGDRLAVPITLKTSSPCCALELMEMLHGASFRDWVVMVRPWTKGQIWKVF